MAGLALLLRFHEAWIAAQHRVTVPPVPRAPASNARSPSGDGAALPAPFRELGGPCKLTKAGARPARPGTRLCANRGQVVGVYGSAEQIPNPPQTATVLSEPRSIRFHDTPFIALEGERLWVRRVTCQRCRVVLGWSFIGHVSSMSERQLLDLQKALGLDGEVPALSTTDAWRHQPMPSLTPPR